MKNKKKILLRNLKIIRNNLILLDKFFEKYKYFFNWTKPKAGSIAFPGFKNKMDLNKFYLNLIKKKGVLLLPGNLYDYDNKHFRIGFGRKNLPEGLELFDEYIKENY